MCYCGETLLVKSSHESVMSFLFLTFLLDQGFLLRRDNILHGLVSILLLLHVFFLDLVKDFINGVSLFLLGMLVLHVFILLLKVLIPVMSSLKGQVFIHFGSELSEDLIRVLLDVFSLDG